MFSWLRNLLRSKPKRELTELLALSDSVIAGLNAALADTNAARQSEKYEKLLLLGGLALQNGGSLELPTVFIDTIQGGSYRLEFAPGTDRPSLVITLTTSPEGE